MNTVFLKVETRKSWRYKVTFNLRVPAMKESIRRTLALLDNPHANARIIAAEISRDPGLSAHILRIANSPFYGMRFRVSSLSHAVMVLGLTALKGILVMMHLYELQYPPSIRKFLNTIYKHLTKSALLAHELIAIIPLRENILKGPEIATAALLHDIGKAIIAFNFPHLVAAIYTSDSATHIEREEAKLGFNHQDVNLALSTRWAFPDVLSIPLSYHHNLSDAPSEHLTCAIIHLIDMILNNRTPDSLALEIVGLSNIDFDQLKNKLIQKMSSNVLKAPLSSQSAV